MRAMAFATAAALLLAGPALADGPISTAAAGSAAPPAAAPPAPIPSLGDVSAFDAPPVAYGPCGPEKVKADGHLETRPHGEVEAGVGTGGYRHVAGVVCQPIGDKAAVTVGFSQTQDNGRYARRR